MREVKDCVFGVFYIFILAVGIRGLQEFVFYCRFQEWDWRETKLYLFFSG